MNSTSTRKWLLLGGLIITVYLVRGFYFLALSPRLGAGDLRFRKTELFYFMKGQNPYETFLANVPPYSATAWDFGGRNTKPDPVVGVGDTMSLPAYPPWAYPLITVFAWPDWPATRLYFAFLNLLALAGIAWGIYEIAGRGDRGLLISTACLMNGTFCMTLGLGQLGILTLLFLVLALVFETRERENEAGVLLGLSLLKPTISLPFLLPFLVKKKGRALLIAALTVCALWAITAVVTKTPPYDLLKEWLAAASALKFEGDGPAHWFAQKGIPRSAFTVLTILVSVPLIFWLRKESWILLFGVTSVAARFWTYHRFYDNILLVFLMTAFIDTTHQKVSPRWFWPAFGVLALTMWPPASAFVYLTNEFQYFTWTACGAWLVAAPRILKNWQWPRV